MARPRTESYYTEAIRHLSALIKTQLDSIAALEDALDKEMIVVHPYVTLERLRKAKEERTEVTQLIDLLDDLAEEWQHNALPERYALERYRARFT